MNEQFEHKLASLIRSRRTINHFRREAPPEERVIDAIELACWAPNHKMTEPWRFYLLGPETVAQIVELNSSMLVETKGQAAADKKRKRWSEIPGWLLVTYLRSEDPVRDQENYAAVCCSIQNCTLALLSHGIGVKWSTGPITTANEFYELLKIDQQQEKVVGLLWYGYPDEAPTSRRKPTDEVLTKLP